jgi:hypothetical protein
MERYQILFEKTRAWLNQALESYRTLRLQLLQIEGNNEINQYS